MAAVPVPFRGWGQLCVWDIGETQLLLHPQQCHELAQSRAALLSATQGDARVMPWPQPVSLSPVPFWQRLMDMRKTGRREGWWSFNTFIWY